MEYLGSKTITFIALALATGGCYVLSLESAKDNFDVTKDDKIDPIMIAIKNSLTADYAIAGYLLICTSIAFLTSATLDEVM